MSDRKYRQKGYQDSGRDAGKGGRSGQGPRGPRDRNTGPPRGRGLGKPTATVFRCAVCGRQSAVSDLRKDSECGHCGAALHTCTHCTYFDTTVAGECRHDDAEYIASKAKQNDCSYFEPRTTLESSTEAGSTTSSSDPKDASSAKAAFDALFDL